MRNGRPDLSNHEASIGLLSNLFPQLGPVGRLIDDSNTVYTRQNAPLGILIQIVRTFAAGCFFMVAVWLIMKIEKLIPGFGKGKDSPILRLISILFGLPAMLIILVSLNRAFDLFYLFVTGTSFDVAGQSLKSVKIFLLVIGFIASLVGSAFAWFAFEGYLNEQNKRHELAAEQVEYFKYLDQGPDAWNKYITAGPKHNIDFSHADLSNRTFRGFFFEFVRFNDANLSGAVFEDCNLQSAYLDGATCHKTSFKNSYLRMADFVGTDLTSASFEGACADRDDFRKAIITPQELARIRPPAESRWHNTSWQNFHTPEWLREKGYSF